MNRGADVTGHHVFADRPVTRDDVRAIVREELTKHIPAGVIRSNERASATSPYRGPLLPDEWAAAVVQHAEYEKWLVDQSTAAARRSVGALPGLKGGDASFESGDRRGGVPDDDPEGVEWRRTVLDGLVRVVDKLSGDGQVGGDSLEEGPDVAHHVASPSVDGSGELTVGDGQVAEGVSPSATDATGGVS